MSVVVRLHDDSVDDDDDREILVSDRTLTEVASQGAEASWTMPVKVRAKGGVVQLVVTVTAYKAMEIRA